MAFTTFINFYVSCCTGIGAYAVCIVFRHGYELILPKLSYRAKAPKIQQHSAIVFFFYLLNNTHVIYSAYLYKERRG